MMFSRKMSLLGVLLVAGMTCGPAASGGDDPAQGPLLPARWEYSMDGGKTFLPDAPTITWGHSPNERKDSVIARATFDVADPDKVGLIKLMVGGTEGAFALTDADSVDRYNVRTRPNLTKMKLALNNRETDAGLAPCTLYRYVPIDPTLVKKGPNTLVVSGVYWFQFAPPTPAPLRLAAIPASLPELDRLPVLGAIGEDYFAVAARSIAPAQFLVAVKPLDPAGAERQYKAERTRQMKIRVPLPAGTRKFQYSVAVSAGGAAKTYGPYEVRMPAFGEGFRFAAMGNTAVYRGDSRRLKKVLTRILEVHPDVLIHVGNYVDSMPWDFMWTELFLDVAPETFARIPLFPLCGMREMASPVAFSRQFYFPPDDKDFARWTTAIGKVRFVAIETWAMSHDQQGEGLKWLDKVLAAAKEEYVVILNAQVSHCSVPNAGRTYRPIAAYTAQCVDPLLVKYKATVAIGGYHTGYERAEPPATEGIPTIMTCFAGGSGKPLQQVYVDQNKDSRATHVGDHFVLFEVTKGKLVMQAMDLDGKVFDTREFAPRK
jgi:hypothetical protein